MSARRLRERLVSSGLSASQAPTSVESQAKKLARSIGKFQSTLGFESRGGEDHVQKRLPSSKPHFDEKYTCPL